MKILITSAQSRLSRSLARLLGERHEIVLTDRGGGPEGFSSTRCDLGHDPSTHDLVAGVDGIVHAVESEGRPTEQFDHATRCTYNLLRAAVEESVPRFVYLNSLDVMNGHGEDCLVFESWRPIPTTDPGVLAGHLGEYVCREFSRSEGITAVSLRLGPIVWNGGDGVPLTSALFEDDAIQAVELALTTELTGWHTFHIQSAVPDARYLICMAERMLGYQSRWSG